MNNISKFYTHIIEKVCSVTR